MNTKPDVYLFGQVLGTHSFLLRDGFLQPDERRLRSSTFCPAVKRVRQPRYFLLWELKSGWTVPGLEPKLHLC